MDTKISLANLPHHHNHLKKTFIVPFLLGTKYIALFNSDFNVLTTVLSWSRTVITIYIKFEATDKVFHRLQCTLMKREWGRNKVTFKLLYVSINQGICSVLIAHWRHNILTEYGNSTHPVTVYLMNVSMKNLSVRPLNCRPLKIPVCYSCVGGF